MRSVLNYVLRENQYYPTPEKLAEDILYRLGRDRELENLKEIHILEPCAGDGALCRVMKAEFGEAAKIDCLEIEPVLRQSLQGQGFHVVGEDFETFESMPFYDLIFMNPPFNKGANFLLRAYDLLNGNGRLICILNAETIKNPFTKERERLQALIEKVGEVEFIENAFSKGKRKSNIEIAVVMLKKPIYENEFDVFGDLKKDVLSIEEQVYEQLREQVTQTDLVGFDKIENAVSIYRTSVKTLFQSIEAIRAAQNSLKYIEAEAKEFNIDMEQFLNIIIEGTEIEAKEEVTKNIRKMAWSYVLKFCDMDKYLFSKQQQDFYDKLDKGSADLPFTRNNISQFFQNLFEKRQEYLNQGIKDLFEEITRHHSGNPYREEGWKTNKNWKINKKIITQWGGFEYSWGSFSLRYGRNGWQDDLDRIVRRIRPMDTRGFTIREALELKFRCLGRIGNGAVIDNTCETPYFHIRFFKKGTLHITFKDQTILDELNQLGAGLRRDLGYDDWGKKPEDVL